MQLLQQNPNTKAGCTVQSHVPNHSSAKTGPHQEKLLSYFLQKALSLGSYLQEDRCVWHGETFYFYQQHSWMMHISTFSFYTEKLLTAIFTLNYTLQIRKLKMALDRKPRYNHGPPSERGNYKVLFKTGSPSYMIKRLQKNCSDLHLSLITNVFLLAS